jgi:Xaa-Pro aminopeptidase
MLKNENSIYYECGYSCDNALYLRLGLEAYFITDGRYTIDANENVQNAKVVIGRDIYGEAFKILKKSKVKKVIFDPKEWSVAGFKKLSLKSKIMVSGFFFWYASMGPTTFWSKSSMALTLISGSPM